MTAAYVYAAARTPFGRFGGALADVRPDDLAATAITGVLAKAPDLDPERIADVVWGNANGAGEDNRNVGRMAVLLAGLPTSVPAVTVNRLCGSSLDAAMAGSRTIESGDADVVLTGGVESMTRAPWVLPKPSRAFPAGNVTAVSTTLGWRLVNERMPAEWTVSLGEANEQLADRFGISRQRQDEFAARSHNLADAAWNDGFYDDLVVPVEGVDLTRDEGIRPGSTAEKLAGLKPSFRPRRHHHAGQRLSAQRRRLGGAARLRGRPRRDRRRPARARSPGAAPSRSSRRTSGSRRSRRSTRPWPARASPGTTSPRSSSTRRSPCSPWRAWTSGRSTPTSSTPRVAPSPSATRSGPPAVACSAPSPTGSASPATGGGSPRSASASGRASRSCWRTRRNRVRTAFLDTADEAVADVADGATVLIGGFGLAGMPIALIDALIRQGASDLTIVNNNAGNGDTGLAALLAKGRVRKVICSFPRQHDSWVFDDLYRRGAIELELVPQGNLAERMRAAGAGIGAFFCPTGVGTPLAEGKETREIDGRTYVLEYPIRGDVALIGALRADRAGNLVYRKTARNFGPVMATAATTVVAEVRELVDIGGIDPETVVTPGIFVDRVVVA